MGDAFEVAFVCTGNRFRSVLAASFMEKVGKDVPLKASSCGTLDVSGQPALVEAVEAARGLRLDLSGHRSRFVGATDLRGADLVLGFEHVHIAAAVLEGGAPANRCFLLLELNTLLSRLMDRHETDPMLRARRRVAAANEMRNGSGGFVPGAEISDPFGREPATVRAIAEEVVAACSDVATSLFGEHRTVAS